MSPTPATSIPVTHVGSLVRPDELIAYLRAIDAAEPYDEDGFGRCLRDSYTGQEVIARDIANLKAAMADAGVERGFLPVVAPASCFPTLIDDHYGSDQAAVFAVAEALREEYRAIVDAGLCPQIDDAFIPFMYDVLVPPGTMQDYLTWAQPRIDALNHAIEGIPEGAALASRELA